MALRCVSPKLLDLVSIQLLRQSAESWKLESEAEPISERVRVATRYSDQLALAVLKQPGASVLDETNAHGQTALMWAAGHGFAPLCALLLEAGVRKEAVDSGGWTALFRAAWHGREAAVSVLIRAGADVNSRGAKYTPLMAAARFGHKSVVERLLLANADPAATTVFGETALSLARQQHHQETVKLLLGDSGSARSKDPLWSACWWAAQCQFSLAIESQIPYRRHAVGAFGRKEAIRAFEAALAGQ